ncbi:hypothetical protein IX84_00045 [Phaeodactylibacter xiamenensis]|uniref:Uncharacterized protein n=1 Tax=Phaeodactylibacter xiamenensis TaxID=1524460 RepID=A0A098SC97_9BACT|nr:hypothetical protein IX84_00045 [Phaeodactylibacter xiamenensis]
MRFIIFLFVTILFAYLIFANHSLLSGINPFSENLNTVADIVGRVSPLEIFGVYSVVMFALFFGCMFARKESRDQYLKY